MAAMNIDIDKLTYEIFSILESDFLNRTNSPSPSSSKIRILSIDAASDGGLLAAAALSHLETLLRKHSGDPSSRIADFFDLAAGSGSGGLLAALLFSPGPNGRPLLTADESLRLLKNRRKNGIFRRIFRSDTKRFRRILSRLTLRSAIKPVLIPCYDLLTSSAFAFSRTDAVESDGYDFAMGDACAATCTVDTVEVRSVDGRTRIRAVGGGVGMGNPTAAAITHVLNNKREFPLADGVEDLLVVSLGSSKVAVGGGGGGGRLAKIVGEAAADQVDQSVAMAFGESNSASYVRIQANELTKVAKGEDLVSATEAVLSQRNIESVMFRGKKMSNLTNGEKIEWVSSELIKEQERRRRSSVPTVMIKPVVTAVATMATLASSL